GRGGNTGSVGHGDAVSRGGFEIDIIGAGSPDGEQTQRGRALEHRRGEPRGRSDIDHDLRTRDALQQPFLRAGQRVEVLDGIAAVEVLPRSARTEHGGRIIGHDDPGTTTCNGHTLILHVPPPLLFSNFQRMSVPESAVEFMSGLIERARKLKRRIVFPEGSDPRVLDAARRLARDGVVRPILIGSPPAQAADGVTFVDPATSPALAKYAAIYHERRRSRGVTSIEAEAIARKPLYFASLMVAAGDAEGSVGGAANTTAETVRAALHAVGPKPGMRLVSSAFIMALPDKSFGHNGLIAFADCAVVIEPSAVDMAEIAIASAATTRSLINAEPIVALLSFSTKGSGRHPQVDKVVEAWRIVRER